MPYVCMHCGKKVKAMDGGFVRCPACGYRALKKARPNLAREVSTD
ncbi:MAG: DNA-directed RNA polymerase subunit P [Candidatus Micrarchaeota archaeon]|nr:DNA-directed RNA polymerase subunit P [Candidatus Micrarchaeota archaeon]